MKHEILFICRPLVCRKCHKPYKVNFFKKCVSFFRVASLIQVKGPARPSAPPAAPCFPVRLAPERRCGERGAPALTQKYQTNSERRYNE